MSPALATTAADLGAALTMRPRRGVRAIVADIFGPIPEGVEGRRAIEQRRSLAMWCGRKLNLTDREMHDQFGYGPTDWDHAERRIDERRAEYAEWRVLCDAVLKACED